MRFNLIKELNLILKNTSVTILPFRYPVHILSRLVVPHPWSSERDAWPVHKGLWERCG